MVNKLQLFCFEKKQHTPQLEKSMSEVTTGVTKFHRAIDKK